MKDREPKSRRSARRQPVREDSTAREPTPRDRSARRPYVYRGRTIEVVPGPAEAAARTTAAGAVQGRLRIDDREVAYEQTDEGVYSHEMTYMRFGSPEELAEELIRQWGEARPEPGQPPHHDHDHGHSEGGHGNHGGHGQPHRG